MARGIALDPRTDPRTGQGTISADLGEIVLIAVPSPTYKALSDAAAKKGLTAVQLLARAIDSYLGNPPR